MTPERWEKVGKLYEEASELKPEARAAFLEQACASDNDLRREVEALLAAERYVGDFIASPALKDAAGLLASHAPGALIGKQFGHYELLSFLGAGGMGEVYAARDTRLGRKVALKLLPAVVARDRDRLRRFEQEARAIGMLNHPNILTIHDIGTHEEAPFIVSELLEGETLRAWIKDKLITPRKAVDFALQTARGLAAAHTRGIVHRDLKPENVFITKDGRVKILDFGLAKLVHPGGNGTEASGASPFIRTDSGIVMGTVGYMAPEQVRGEETDHRADVFAFGVILYEMFAGTPPFRGETAVETMNAILKTEAPELPIALREQSPGLERIIHRCLEKRPEQRFQSTNDLGFALEALTATGLGSPSERQRAAAAAWFGGETRPTLQTWLKESPLGRVGWLGWFLAGALALATVALATAYFKQPAAEVETMRLTITPPEKATRVGDPIISPDGRRLAFVAFAENKWSLWVRPLGSLTAQPLPGTDGASSPFWAPDGQAIGFFAQGKLKKIALSGEPPVTLCDAPSPRGGTWNSNGVIIFVPHQNAGVQRVSANGGAPTPVTTPNTTRQESNHLWPSFLPDGRHFLYLTTSQQPEEAGIYLASLEGGERRRLLAASSNAVYAAASSGTGYLFFAREGTLLAQPFDANKQQVSGEAMRLAEHIAVNTSGKAGFSISRNGLLVHSASTELSNQQISWFDRAGKPLGAIGAPGAYLSAALAPTEDRVAVTRADRQTRTLDIWLLDLASGSELRFTLDPANDLQPLWSPDGSRIAWLSLREGAPSFYQKPVSGTGQAELLFRSDHQKSLTDWSRDGGYLIFQDNDPKTKWDIWILPLAGERKPVPFAHTQYNESNGRLSPDARWIAYTSDESGSNEVYVQTFNPTGQSADSKWQISAKGGDQPRWRGDGKELFYVASGKVMSVEVKSGVDFQISAPKELFDLRGLRTTSGSVARDGKRFLFVSSVEETNALPFTAVLNWAAELQR